MKILCRRYSNLSLFFGLDVDQALVHEVENDKGMWDKIK